MTSYSEDLPRPPQNQAEIDRQAVEALWADLSLEARIEIARIQHATDIRPANIRPDKPATAESDRP